MNTSEDVMRQRMVQRGRGDDNDETIWKRFGEAYNAPLCWQAMCTVRADIPPPSDVP
jgi:ribose 1,5-bisphosphokinase PhnN